MSGIALLDSAAGKISLVDSPAGKLALIDAFSVSTRYRQVVIADAPVGYWPLDETSGNVAKDLSGHNYNGTITSATLAQPGLSGDQSTSFYMGANPTVIVPYYAALHPEPGPFSAEFWMANISSATVGGGFFDNSDSLLMYGGGSNPGHMFCALAHEIDYSAIAYNDATGVYHHWVWTRTGDAITGASILYRDGVAVVSIAPSATLPPNVNTTNLGERAAGSPASQRMGHFALYNYVLTPQQVLNHYNAGLTGLRGTVALLDYPAD